MLKNLPPLLTPDLLWVLAAAGHGDDIAVVDANFPARAVSAKTVFGRPVEIPGANVPDLLAAILEVFPPDTFVPTPVLRMEVVDAPDEIPPVQSAALPIVRAALKKGGAADAQAGSLERFAFYEAAKKSFAVAQAGGEGRPYGCFLLKKGVVFFENSNQDGEENS